MESQPTMCSGCPDKLELLVLRGRLEEIRKLLDGAPSRRERVEEFATPAGKLIAAAASARGRSLAAVSMSIGHEGDYLVRVCRGKLKLTAPTASALERELGVELSEYVVATKRAPRKPKINPAAPELPAFAGEQQGAA